MPKSGNGYCASQSCVQISALLLTSSRPSTTTKQLLHRNYRFDLLSSDGYFLYKGPKAYLEHLYAAGCKLAIVDFIEVESSVDGGNTMENYCKQFWVSV